jgi:hypothetical protein
MNHPIKRIFGITLSALAALLIAQPGFAQASGSISASGANQGSSGGTTQTTQHGVTDLSTYQNYSGATNAVQAPQVRDPGGQLDPTTTGNLARDKSQGGSVDMSPFPSGNFMYGFPQASPQVYMYQSNPGMSPGLPSTATSSVDFNTVDCPFIAPVGDDPASAGMGAETFALPALQALPPNQFINGQAASTQQAQSALNTFFGLP